jgi:hypothetical protein
MILRSLLLLTSVFTIVLAGFWPAFVDKAVLNVRQVIGDVTGEETTDAAGAGAAGQQTQQAAGNGAATAATQQTQAAGAAATAATTATPANAAPNAATTPTTTRTPANAPAAAADTDTDTTTTTPAAAAPVAPVAPAAPAADTPAANPADFEVPYTMQTGTIRYAPMAVVVPSKITKKNPTPLYPTSDYTPYLTKAGAASQVVTVTQPFTFQTVSSEAVSINYPTTLAVANVALQNIPAASGPADADMQKFLNRWKD